MSNISISSFDKLKLLSNINLHHYFYFVKRKCQYFLEILKNFYKEIGIFSSLNLRQYIKLLLLVVSFIA